MKEFGKVRHVMFIGEQMRRDMANVHSIFDWIRNEKYNGSTFSTTHLSIKQLQSEIQPRTSTKGWYAPNFGKFSHEHPLDVDSPGTTTFQRRC